MRIKLFEVTDEALLQACRRRPFERWLEGTRFGNAFCIACGLVAAVFVYRVSTDDLKIVWAIGAAFIGLIVGAVALDRTVNIRSRRFQNELLARNAPWEPSDFSHKPAIAFTDEFPPDFVLVLRGCALPYGGTRSVRVSLWQGEPPRGQLDVRTRSRVEFSRDEPFVSEAGATDLSPEKCASLPALLPPLLDTRPEEIISLVNDGFPCEMGVLRRQPRTVVTHRCNLAGLPEADATRPAPTLMGRLLDLSERVTTQPMVVGWTDYFGNIGIDEA